MSLLWKIQLIFCRQCNGNLPLYANYIFCVNLNWELKNNLILSLSLSNCKVQNEHVVTACIWFGLRDDLLFNFFLSATITDIVDDSY